MSDFPPTSLQHASHADDFTSWASSSSVPTAAEILTGHADDMANWANKKDLQISTQKSTATLFTSENRQSQLNPDITLNSHLLPLDRRPKILGVTFDTHLTFSPHINSVTDRVASRLSISSSLWRVLPGDSRKKHLLSPINASLDHFTRMQHRYGSLTLPTPLFGSYKPHKTPPFESPPAL